MIVQKYIIMYYYYNLFKNYILDKLYIDTTVEEEVFLATDIQRRPTPIEKQSTTIKIIKRRPSFWSSSEDEDEEDEKEYYFIDNEKKTTPATRRNKKSKSKSTENVRKKGPDGMYYMSESYTFGDKGKG